LLLIFFPFRPGNALSPRNAGGFHFVVEFLPLLLLRHWLKVMD
jgi:hypothetical protein